MQRRTSFQAVEIVGFRNRKPGNISRQVKSPLKVIEFFEEQIQDNWALEIAGTNSFYRILEGSKWLIDEEYWLFYSNQTLRISISEISCVN